MWEIKNRAMGTLIFLIITVPVMIMLWGMSTLMQNYIDQTVREKTANTIYKPNYSKEIPNLKK